MVSGAYIRSLPGDEECREALAWIADRAPRYPTGRFIPPLTRKETEAKARKIIALYFRVGRKSRTGVGARISRIDSFDGEISQSFVGTVEDMAASMAKSLLSSKLAGSYLVTSGLRRSVLDVWLSSFGPAILALGYQLLPFCGSDGISFIKIKKGKRTWTLCLFEAMTGVPLSTGMEFAKPVCKSTRRQEQLASSLYSAIGGVSSFLAQTFGSVVHPTAGMAAMDIARRSLPEDFAKWRPVPLLVGMERLGKGYRGGIAYAQRFRGRTWRIDVNRQYTAALRTELPQDSAFGHYPQDGRVVHGVFVCRVSLSDVLAYPLGIWCGPNRGFEQSTVGRGTYVCVLHTSEFPGLRAAGASITPGYGFIFTRTFSLSRFVDAIQAVLDTFGKDSPQGKLTKPIGNYVYGKFGQRAERTELLYSNEHPGDEWFPYWDEYGQAWEQIWERDTLRHTASQHTDVAGAITGAARSQTASMWAFLSAAGCKVVRCHTDSLTTDSDPSDWISTSESTIGEWRVEQDNTESIIVGANAFVDQDGAHVAGVSEPTAEMIERIYDGQVVHVAQNIKAPRRGFDRGLRVSQRTYKASG